MARVFQFNPLLGSLKEKHSGAIPQNFNNATIQQSHKGRVLRLDGTNYLNYPLPNFRNTDNVGTIAFTFRDTGLSSTGIIFSSADISVGTSFCDLFLTPAGEIKFFFFQNGVAIGSPVITPGTNDGLWHLGVISTNGNRYQIFIDNVDYTASIIGTNSGAWFADVSDRDNVVIGALVRAIPISFLKAEIGFIYIDDTEIDATERSRLYQEFQNSQILLQNIVLNRDDPQAQTLHITGDNWDATGQEFTHSIGNGDFEISQFPFQPFKCFEDTTGKYIESTGLGQLKVKGIDLSLFPGNGYIKRIGGDKSNNQGLTVDAASSLSFANNILTIFMGGGQKLRPPLTIVKDATV